MAIELVAKKAETEVQGVAAVLPQHWQDLELLQLKVAAIESKAKSAEEIAAQAISTAQVAMGIVPQHNAQIEKL